MRWLWLKGSATCGGGGIVILAEGPHDWRAVPLFQYTLTLFLQLRKCTENLEQGNRLVLYANIFVDLATVLRGSLYWPAERQSSELRPAAVEWMCKVEGRSWRKGPKWSTVCTENCVCVFSGWRYKNLWTFWALWDIFRMVYYMGLVIGTILEATRRGSQGSIWAVAPYKVRASVATGFGFKMARCSCCWKKECLSVCSEYCQCQTLDK
jgi:hypothetical protein